MVLSYETIKNGYHFVAIVFKFLNVLQKYAYNSQLISMLQTYCIW